MPPLGANNGQEYRHEHNLPRFLDKNQTSAHILTPEQAKKKAEDIEQHGQADRIMDHFPAFVPIAALKQPQDNSKAGQEGYSRGRQRQGKGENNRTPKSTSLNRVPECSHAHHTLSMHVLQLMQRFVLPSCCKEFIMGTAFEQSTIFEHNNSIGIFNG